MEYSLEETIGLIAQDLRTARTRLGITSTQAAKRAGLSGTYYRRLEKGLIPSTQLVLRKLFSVCQRMDMGSVRVNYLREFDQYANIDLSSNPSSRRIIAFLDTLKAEVAELENIECFLSPDSVVAFFKRVGFQTVLASRKRSDKQMVELLNASLFSLCLEQDRDYYVRPVKDDPPDVELLMVDRNTFVFTVVKLEITQHGQYSQSLFEVIGNKLAKRYHKDTFLVVIVEGVERIAVAELDKFIRENNPHDQQIVIIGGTGRPEKFFALPWDQVTSPSPGVADWTEIDFDLSERSTGFRGYSGVFCDPSLRGQWVGFPLFVKEVVLSR